MENNIGQKVIKKSGKPFKSGEKINTIKNVIPHPILKNEMAYTFEEDDSYVEIRKCEILS
jgi:hypothetical protein